MIISLGEERANLIAFRTFVRFAVVWFCLFPLPLGVWEGLRFVIVAHPGLCSYLFCLPLSWPVCGVCIVLRYVVLYYKVLFCSGMRCLFLLYCVILELAL